MQQHLEHKLASCEEVFLNATAEKSDKTFQQNSQALVHVTWSWCRFICVLNTFWFLHWIAFAGSACFSTHFILLSCVHAQLSEYGTSPHNAIWYWGLHGQGWESTAHYTFTPCVHCGVFYFRYKAPPRLRSICNRTRGPFHKRLHNR